MHRPPLLLCALVAVALTAPALGAKPRSWAHAEIELVAARGLMGGDPAAFRADDPLTRGELAELAAGLTQQPLVPPSKPSASATIERLDSTLVRALGLGESATAFRSAAQAAGLEPPARLGTEAVARLLGLRVDHPSAADMLEPVPTQAASRAEAAYSGARILRFRGWETAAVATAAESFSLPPLTVWQRRVLGTAFRFVGYPYVWAGTSERPQAPLGIPVPGGFDCSGFVWRIYRLERYPGGSALAATLRGRTTYAMSGEVPRARRIAFAKLAPGDVVFFGARGARSKPAEVSHMGIYTGGGWFVHSSRNGVALDRLTGWYRSRFAWARRPLAEAGLEPTP